MFSGSFFIRGWQSLLLSLILHVCEVLSIGQISTALAILIIGEGGFLFLHNTSQCSILITHHHLHVLLAMADLVILLVCASFVAIRSGLSD